MSIPEFSRLKESWALLGTTCEALGLDQFVCDLVQTRQLRPTFRVKLILVEFHAALKALIYEEMI